MPISKTGNLLTKGLGYVGKKLSPFIAPIVTGSMGLSAANDFASGERSLGGIVGELAGGAAGWSMGQKLMRKLPQVKYLSPALNLAVPMFVTSGIGASVGEHMGNALAPWQRGQGNQEQFSAGGSQGYLKTPEGAESV